MKKNKWINLVMVLLLFASFSCDDDDDDDQKSNLLGFWSLSKITTTNCDDPDDNMSTAITCDDLLCIEIEFLNNDKVIVNYVLFGEQDYFEGTYEETGSTITLCDDDDTGCETFTFSLQNKKLILTQKDGEDGCDSVQEFTKQ
jgi:hypothetical protein